MLKMVIQTINNKRILTPDFNPVFINKDNFEETLNLNSENYLQISLSLDESKKVRVIIVGTGKWKGLTAYGNLNSIKVVDSDDFVIELPSIKILGDNPITIGINSNYVDGGATGTDFMGNDLEVNVDSDVDTSKEGTYYVTYATVDFLGNSITEKGKY